jgi:hypothetical protein
MSDAALHPDEQGLGLVAEFSTPDAAAAAARSLRAQEFHDLEAYGPFPSAELAEAIGFKERRIAPCVLGGGIAGGLFGFCGQVYVTTFDYPHNIGGRPMFSWPAFLPTTFECAVLGATIVGLVSLFVLNRQPRLSHPVFSAEHFERATTDRFFIYVKARAPGFSFPAARDVLGKASPLSISLLTQEKEEKP